MEEDGEEGGREGLLNLETLGDVGGVEKELKVDILKSLWKYSMTWYDLSRSFYVPFGTVVPWFCGCAINKRSMNKLC
jgi:hypothetical protein